MPPPASMRRFPSRLPPPGFDEAFAAAGFDDLGTARSTDGVLGPGFGRCNPAGRTRGQSGFCSHFLTSCLQGSDHIALVDPYLDPDGANRGTGGGHSKIDVGAKRVQRHPTFAIPLTAAHIGTAQAAVGLDPDSFCAGFHGRGNRPLHGPTERDTVFELICDPPCEELGIGLGVTHFDDVELDSPAGEFLQPGPEAVGLGSFSSDNNAGTGGVNLDDDFVAGPLDLDARYGTTGQFPLEIITDLPVFVDEFGVFLVAIPT